MISLIKIAYRNLLRNARRSGVTMSAIAVGATAMLCFGQFISRTVLEFQSGVVRNSGHLAVMRKGYFEFGSGDPAGYSIPDYARVIRAIKADPQLRQQVRVVTPRINIFGVAGNFKLDASTAFAGVGVVPADYTRMREWDAYGLDRDQPRLPTGLSDTDDSVGVIGIGMARILGVCEPLHVAGCPKIPPRNLGPAAQAVEPPPVSFAELAGRDVPAAAQAAAERPHIDLLVSTSRGAPNVSSLTLSAAEPQGIREMDDSYIRMNFNLAQRLLYGRAEGEAISIVIQLNRTEDMNSARARLTSVLKTVGPDLEVRDYRELNPFYAQGAQFLQAIFVFIAVIMAVIVLFTVVNTMSMTVLERTNEIGTARAIGVRRGGIRAQFILEGTMLGGFGATAGLVLAQLIGVLVNILNISMTFPGSAQSSPLRLLTSSAVAPLMIGVWLGLVVMAVLAAIIPANKAARMPVVDALRYV